MRAVEFPSANRVYHLKGGTEANDLHVQQGPHAGADGIVEAGDPTYHLAYTRTVWTPDELERAELATGRNIELVILGAGGVPPLMLGVTDDAPAGETQDELSPGVWLVLRGALLDDVIHVLDRLKAHADESDVTVEAAPRLARLDELRANLTRHREELQRYHDEQAQPEQPEPEEPSA
jgi:hypothetical protein